MANPARGEVPLVAGGRTYTLCLTLGALAEIEAVCDTPGAPLDAGRLVRVLAALIRGGGTALDEAAVRELPVDAETAAAAVAACFEAAG